MDGKSWIYFVFLIIYTIYQVMKQRNKKQEELPPSEPRSSSPDKGLEDLIAEFNKAYGVETVENEVEIEPDPEPVMEVDPREKMPTGKPDISDYIVKEKSEPQTLHEKVLLKEKELKKSQEEKVEIENIPLDLKTLILSETILNRPKY